MRTYRFIIGVRRSFSHQGSSSYSVKRKKQVLFELFFLFDIKKTDKKGVVK